MSATFWFSRQGLPGKVRIFLSETWAYFCVDLIIVFFFVFYALSFSSEAKQQRVFPPFRQPVFLRQWPFPIVGVSVAMTGMEDEMRELRELVAQLKADNDRLRSERELPGPSTVPVALAGVPGPPQSVKADSVVPERFVFVPRDRRCPNFSGKSGPQVLMSGWRRLRHACGLVICPKLIKHFFSLGSHGR